MGNSPNSSTASEQPVAVELKRLFALDDDRAVFDLQRATSRDVASMISEALLLKLTDPKGRNRSVVALVRNECRLTVELAQLSANYAGLVTVPEKWCPFGDCLSLVGCLRRLRTGLFVTPRQLSFALAFDACLSRKPWQGNIGTRYKLCQILSNGRYPEIFVSGGMDTGLHGDLPESTLAQLQTCLLLYADQESRRTFPALPALLAVLACNSPRLLETYEVAFGKRVTREELQTAISHRVLVHCELMERAFSQRPKPLGLSDLLAPISVALWSSDAQMARFLAPYALAGTIDWPTRADRSLCLACTRDQATAGLLEHSDQGHSLCARCLGRFVQLATGAAELSPASLFI